MGVTAIYFGDIGGDIEEERGDIQKFLRSKGIYMKIKETDLPPWEDYFDVLFFDWGGISVGNSMLEHFCRWIIEHAENNPGKVYVMTSVFTAEAMEDALHQMPDPPNNIYLNLKDPKTVRVLSVFQD